MSKVIDDYADFELGQFNRLMKFIRYCVQNYYRTRNEFSIDFFDVSRGICVDLPHKYVILIKSIFEEWPEFSGDNNYPIYDPNLVPEYINFYNLRGWLFHNNFNKWTGSYGALRFELLQFIIEYVEETIEARRS